MKTFSKKLTAIVMLAVMSLSAFCLGFIAMFSTAPAIAAETTFTHDNLTLFKMEDIEYDRLSYYDSKESTSALYSLANGGTINKLVAGTSVKWGLYTNAATASDVNGEYKTNINQHDGNFSSYSSGTKYRDLRIAYATGSGYGAGKAFAFKTVYNSKLNFELTVGTTDGNANRVGSGFLFDNENNQFSIIKSRSVKKSYTYADCLAKLTAAGKTDTELFNDGDILTVYFGVWGTVTTATAEGSGEANYYFQVFNNTKGIVVAEETYSDTYGVRVAGNAVYFRITNLEATNAAIIAGVNKPILQPIKTLQTVNADLTEVKTLNDISLPAGYTFKNPTTAISGFTSAAAEFDYYGEKSDCTVNIVDATEIEEVVDTTDDITWKMNRSLNLSGAVLGAHYWSADGKPAGADINQVNTFYVNKDTDNQETYQWALYSDESTTDTATYNGNKYANNLSFYANDSVEQIVYFTQTNKGEQPKDRVLSLRMNYQNTAALIVRATTTSQAVTSTGASYTLEMLNTSVTIHKGASITSSQQKYVYETPFEVGDDLIVTYGAYDLNSKTYVYISIYNVTKGYQVIDETYDTGALDEANTNYLMGVRFAPKFEDATKKDLTPVSFGGIYEPLLAEYDYTVEETLTGDKAGALVKDAITLKTGYSFVDETQTLAIGENKIAVTYALTTDDYYVASNRSATVTVTVDGNDVIINDMAGAEIQKTTVGATFTLPTLDRSKTFIAYKVGDTLYKQGDVINLTADTTVVLYEADMGVEDKVSVRIANNANGYGGLRFTAKILTADLTALKDVGFEVGTAIVPLDMINTASAVKYQALADEFVEGDYTYAYFTITDLKYGNFAREYAGRIAVKVGENYVYGETVSESAYGAAYTAYDEYLSEAQDTLVLNLSESNEAVLKNYIYGVIDLTYTVDGETVTVDYTANNGLEESWFKNIAVETASISEGVLSASLTLSVDGDNGAVETLINGNGLVPVLVRGGDAIKAASVTVTTLESGVLTVEFQVKVA